MLYQGYILPTIVILIVTEKKFLKMSQKNILLFGAGKSASVLIDYLINEASESNWMVTVADANRELIETKTQNRPFSESIEIDVTNEAQRLNLIQKSDIVISMMPPFLHILIAKDCVKLGKSLLTASYADDEIKKLEQEVIDKGLLFLCEMGLDPGIDHMSAMELIDDIKEKNGVITSFKSHCGGLVAPESDDNPWHYKISWNPRNVVLAGKSGATYKENNIVVTEKYESLFDENRLVTINDGDEKVNFSYYPNRNSLPYIDLYNLKSATTFVRTTLRHPNFMCGWKAVVDLGLTDEASTFESDGKSLHEFFQFHLDENKMQLKNPMLLEQFEFLGLNDKQTIVNKGLCSNADVLQLALEKKLVLHKNDKDMIVMLHEIEYELNGVSNYISSTLVVKGEDSIHTAMAKTVGLPLGIAAKFILNGTIQLTGLHIPTLKEIYLPVLEELKKYGVRFG
jgi:saccharopine dehydrogenase-like NADP-dependent oxidoreductase